MRCSGIGHVPARGRAMLVGNHSGGIAIDAAMVIASSFLEMEPPRLAQGMAEKFINRLPFASVWTARCGQLTGLPEHAQRLLESERLLLVFPEGARGTAKLWKDRYSLVDFGSGFMRLALRTKSPIVPFAFLGGGDAIPTVTNLYKVGNLLGLPYLPVTPWLLPLPGSDERSMNKTPVAPVRLAPPIVTVKLAPAFAVTGERVRSDGALLAESRSL